MNHHAWNKFYINIFNPRSYLAIRIMWPRCCDAFGNMSAVHAKYRVNEAKMPTFFFYWNCQLTCVGQHCVMKKPKHPNVRLNETIFSHSFLKTSLWYAIFRALTTRSTPASVLRSTVSHAYLLITTSVLVERMCTALAVFKCFWHKCCRYRCKW